MTHTTHTTGHALNCIITKKQDIIKAGLLKDFLSLEYGYAIDYKRKNGSLPKTKFYYGRM